MKLAHTRNTVLMAAVALVLGTLSGQALAKDHDNHGHGHDDHHAPAKAGHGHDEHAHGDDHGHGPAARVQRRH